LTNMRVSARDVEAYLICLSIIKPTKKVVYYKFCVDDVIIAIINLKACMIGVENGL
jgi:hypothetical protein